MNEPEAVFELEREDMEPTDLKLASEVKCLHEKSRSDLNISFLPCARSIISEIYPLSGSFIKFALDELYPSLKVKNKIYSLTRVDNPRVLEVRVDRNEILIGYLISLINAINLTSLERAKAFNDLKSVGLEKEIECSLYAFVSKLLRVDEKTLRKDCTNANSN